MSRSHHITKKQAVKRYLSDGDTEGILHCHEKQTVKRVVRKFRPIYDEIHPSAKPDNKLRGSVAHRAALNDVKRRATSAKETPDA